MLLCAKHSACSIRVIVKWSRTLTTQQKLDLRRRPHVIDGRRALEMVRTSLVVEEIRELLAGEQLQSCVNEQMNEREFIYRLNLF